MYRVECWINLLAVQSASIRLIATDVITIISISTTTMTSFHSELLWTEHYNDSPRHTHRINGQVLTLLLSRTPPSNGQVATTRSFSRCSISLRLRQKHGPDLHENPNLEESPGLSLWCRRSTLYHLGVAGGRGKLSTLLICTWQVLSHQKKARFHYLEPAFFDVNFGVNVTYMGTNNAY